eukprot:180273_1
MSTNESNIKKEMTICDNIDNQSVKQEPTNNNGEPNNDNDINIKNKEMTSSIQNPNHYPGPVECIVYWDYYNHPIPSTYNFKNIIPILKQNICNK